MGSDDAGTGPIRSVRTTFLPEPRSFWSFTIAIPVQPGPSTTHIECGASMMYRSLNTAAVALAIALTQTPAAAQSHDHDHPDLHVNPRWKECSFQLSSSLSQAAWRQFTREAGLVAYFRPLSDARPMGKGRFELSALQWQTGIDDHDAAWNDTFVHPDSAHWLFEGEGLKFPGVMVRAGVSENTDVGVYFTKSPGANYGFYAAQIQHALVKNPARSWDAAARVSFASLYGPEDLDLRVVGVDLLASRRFALTSWAAVSPYVGGSTYLSNSHEKTALVDLHDERVAGAQAMVGATLQLSKARLG
ncbi:MAG TPA: hypothetical protein VM076_04390, partial [Gemmatimonadaceae bacterium]|nr:hypothetical protein [Gemmatimonadaceae bacterium]